MRRNEMKSSRLMSDLLSASTDEMKLILDENRTSVKLSKDDSKSMEIVQRSDGQLEVYSEGSYVGNMLRSEFLREMERELEERYGYGIISDDELEVEDKNLLAIILEIKAAVRKLNLVRENRIEN